MDKSFEEAVKKAFIRQSWPEMNVCIVKHSMFFNNLPAFELLYIVAKADFPKLDRTHVEVVVTNDGMFGIVFKAFGVPIPESYEVVNNFGEFIISSALFQEAL